MDDANQVVHPSLPGRVVRLHFRCHAELPIGSFLRVTGSSLWAPGTSSSDPTDATYASHGIASSDVNSGFSGTTESGPGDPADNFTVTPAPTVFDSPSSGTLYSSSVEMVTSPDEYPIWRTRKPVVVVLSTGRSKAVQHHYYRYLVVAPGGSNDMIHNPQKHLQLQAGGMPGHMAPSTSVDDVDDAYLVSTSNESSGSCSVTEWEDPLKKLGRQAGMNHAVSGVSNVSSGNIASASASAVSLASSTGGPHATHRITSMDYQNLPYRTLDIEVQSGRPMYEDREYDGTVRLDRWNAVDDSSFQPYFIREAINEDNRRKFLSHTSDVTEYMETEQDSQATPVLGSGHVTPPVFGGNSRIFFVCFHLPVVVLKNESTNEWEASWSESILAKTEGSRILSQYEGHWIGTVTTTPPIQSESDKNLVRALLLKMNCTPLFLDTAVRQAHYYGFCKQVLWPAFHNIDLLDMSTSGWLYSESGDAIPDDDAANQSDWDQSRLEDWWNCFQGVNQEFADLMSKMIRQGDIIWIHDYHLALLPQRLAAWETEAFGMTVTRKVFFLHIPFPTSQIFRELECGEQILQGMLHADVVGFHAFDHARHFLNAAKRILGLNYDSIAGGLIGVSFQGSTVLVSMSNVSIEPGNVDAVLMLPSVKEGQEELRRKHQGRIIIGALDIGQSLSGAGLKMLAYERLLQDYPAWQQKVVMVQKLLIPGSRKSDEAVTTREVRRLVKRIQDKFGPDVIDYQEMPGSTLPMDQRLALWCGSDVLMSTPIREGLNHWPMEFIYSHKEPATPGVVIASEFSAISSILNGALRVNPYDIQATVATIDKALSMEMQERVGRRYRDIDFVSSSPSDKWVKNVLRDLKDATSVQARAGNSVRGSQSNSQFSTPYATPSSNRKSFVDSTAAFLARETEVAFSRLNSKMLKKAYETCNRRVLVLDFNGTIVMKEPPGKYLKREILGTSGNKPPPEVLDALTILSNDPKNLIYIVSGDSSENVLNALGNLNGVGLGVSNGARFSPPVNQDVQSASFGQVQRQWLTFDLGVDWDGVKRVALPVLSKYTARSNGSFVKLTSLSIGWSYYSCDPEWGSLQAAHLVLELENELRAFDVRFVTLKGIVEIVPRKLNKGLIVKKILRDRNAEDPDHPVDFLMVMGDDISDEKMFTSVFSFLAEQGDMVNSSPIPPVLRDGGIVQENVSDTLMNNNGIKIPIPQYSFTVAVGKKASHASFYVNDASEVAKCIIQLAGGEVTEDTLHPWGTTTTEQMFC